MPKATIRKISWQKKLLFSSIVTVTFLLALEFLLAAIGVQPLTKTEDPFVGFSEQVPLMEIGHDEHGQEIVHTAANKLVWFNFQSFPRKKNPNTKRIFCIGGSTTYGHPFADSTSFCGWLRELLPVVDDKTNWQLINAGGISYASYRAAAVMEELAQYEPDLFIVYSVHNEFLERRTYQAMFDQSPSAINFSAVVSHTRTYALLNNGWQTVRKNRTNEQDTRDVLPAEVDEILNHTVGPKDYHRDPKWRSQVLQHYELNLQRMVSIAKKAGAQIVIITPASNEKNCSPFKSEFAPELPEEDRTRFWQYVDQADSDTREGNHQSALEALEAARIIEPHFADLHYRMGRTLMQLGRSAEAKQAFQLAIDDDVCPLRAVSEINAAVRRVASKNKVPLVDFDQRLHNFCKNELGHECLGEEYFLDHVHPSIDIFFEWSLWIIEDLQKAKMVGGLKLTDESVATKIKGVRDRVYSQIDTKVLLVGQRNLAKTLHWAGKFEEAIPRARDALQLLPTDPESRFVLADCLRNLGDREAALAEYQRLFSSGKGWPRGYLPYAELLAEQGKFEQAKNFLMLAMLNDPNNPYCHFLLGYVHLEMGEHKFAVESLEESNRLFPNESETLKLLENAKKMLGELDQSASQK